MKRSWSREMSWNWCYHFPRPEFQMNAAWPEKDIWTNANADKMAAVAKLTGEEEDGADTLLNAVWKQQAQFAILERTTHRITGFFSHFVSLLFCLFEQLSAQFAFPSTFCFRHRLLYVRPILSEVSVLFSQHEIVYNLRIWRKIV